MQSAFFFSVFLFEEVTRWHADKIYVEWFAIVGITSLVFITRFNPRQRFVADSALTVFQLFFSSHEIRE